MRECRNFKISSQVCYLCNFLTRSTIILLLCQKELEYNVTATGIFNQINTILQMKHMSDLINKNEALN